VRNGTLEGFLDASIDAALAMQDDDPVR